MKRHLALAISLAALMAPLPALAQSADGSSAAGSIAPTIPESQIEAAEFASPYQFLSAATSVDEFAIQASALAETKNASAEVKTIAAETAGLHQALMRGSLAAGKADGVEIAKPSVDGEQQGLLGKLEALDGGDFDRAYVEAQLFVHQRAIAIYRGYAGKADSLGQFATSALPNVVAQYGKLVAFAEASGMSATPQEPAQN